MPPRLTTDPQNANKGTPRGRALLEDSLRRYGAGRSILVDRNGVVIAGNKTLEAAVDIGLADPVVVPSDGTRLVVVQRMDLDLATDPQAKELALADNRVAQVSLDWDADVLTQLKDEGVDLTRLWTDEELDGLFQRGPVEGLTDPDDVPEERPTDIVRGDLFVLGEHRLLCGDSTNEEDVARVMDGQMADLCLTDPPYGISVVKSGMVGADFGVAKKGRYAAIVGDETVVDVGHLFALAPRRIVWGGNYFADQLPVSGTWLVWDKRVDSGIENTFADCELAWSDIGGPARVYRQLWNGMIRSGEHDVRAHPTQKPVGLMVWCLQRSGDVCGSVLDGYAGSGTTIIACEQLRRRCYAIEIEPRYVQVAIDRWEQFTGRKAVKVAAA